ncbi:MAG: hypothetical protein U0610_29140 [bacterium]
MGETERAWGAARWVWLAAAALTAVILTATFAKTGFGVFGDGVGYYAPLRSLAFDRDLRIDDEVARWAPGRWPHEIPTYSKYPIGTALVLTPFFALGHGLALGLAAAGVNVTADGYSWPYELAYCLGSALLGVAGLLLAAQAARRIAGRGGALVAVLGVWFASPVFYYLAFEPSMAHAVSEALVSLTLYLALTRDWRGRPREAATLGAALGLAALTRPQDALFAVTIGCWGIWPPRSLDGRDVAHPGRRSTATMLGIAAAAALGVALIQVAVYAWTFGSVAAVPYFHEAAAAERGPTFAWLHPRIGAVLFSPLHGLFAWHPLTLVAVAGLVVLAYRDRGLGAGLLLGWLAQLWLVGAWHDWWQGAALGGRMFASSSFAFVLGLAALWRELPSRVARSTLAALTALAALWNLSLAVQYRLGLLPAESPVSLARMARGHLELLARALAKLAGA